MTWYEVNVTAKKEACDAISYFIMSAGAKGVVIDDPKGILESITDTDAPCYLYDYIDENINEVLSSHNCNQPNNVTIKGYFPENTNVDELIGAINDNILNLSKYIETGKTKIWYSLLNETDWADSWKSYYKPFNITSNIVIKPTWEEYPCERDEIIIEMDPGMAFGTGTHETTRMCAELLVQSIRQGDNIIDVGSGSGILSILSAMLGAKRVIALDIDEEAVKVTKFNCKNNKVSDKVRAYKATLSPGNCFNKYGSFNEKNSDANNNSISENNSVNKYDNFYESSCANGEFEYFNYAKVDIIVANIVADVIINLCDAIKFHVKLAGLFIASGIIKDKKNDVLNKYLENGFECKQIVEEGEWVTIAFICPDFL